MMSPDHLFGILCARPFPGTTDLRMSSGACCFTAEHIALGYTHNGWIAFGRVIPDEMPHPSVIDATQVHAEIRRVLALVKSEEDRRRDVEAQLAKITDAHAVVSQRLVGAQKEVADLESEVAGVRDNADRLQRDLDFAHQRRANVQARSSDIERQRDECQSAVKVQRARADAAEAKVKRLLRQRAAAHAVLDEAAIGLEPEGSPRWTLARRCRAAVEPVWDHLDALQAFDVVGEIVGVTGKTGERGFMDAVIARVKALRNDDDTRAAIAVAVGLDDSASLGLILDTVKSADTTKDADLTRLVNYHQAPIRFADRPLTLAERAAFVIRRLWQGRTNAANEAASLRRELGDIEAALGDLPDTAEREPIGDREEHLGLSTAERIRLSR